MSSSGGSDDDVEKKLVEVDRYGPDGLPEGDENAKKAAHSGAVKMVIGITFVSRLIGCVIAAAIYHLGSREAYDNNAKVAFNADSGSRDGAYVFFSAVLFSFLTFWLNMYPMIPKARVMLKNKRIRTNMYIFKVNSPEADDKTPCVILNEEGDCGKYNRANRSMHHFTEYASGLVFSTICASFVFPFPAFILVIVIFIGRIWHQLSYSGSGYGAHAPGFMLFMVGYVTLEMMSLLAGIKQMTLA